MRWRANERYVDEWVNGLVPYSRQCSNEKMIPALLGGGWVRYMSQWHVLENAKQTPNYRNRVEVGIDPQQRMRWRANAGEVVGYDT